MSATKKNKRLPQEELQRLRRAIQEVNLCAASMSQAQDEWGEEVDAGERKLIREEIGRALDTTLMGVFYDQEVPVRKYREWISYSGLRKLEMAGAIKLSRRGGRLLAKPSTFFAMWNALPEDERRKAGPGRPRKGARKGFRK